MSTINLNLSALRSDEIIINIIIIKLQDQKINTIIDAVIIGVTFIKVHRIIMDYKVIMVIKSFMVIDTYMFIIINDY